MKVIFKLDLLYNPTELCISTNMQTSHRQLQMALHTNVYVTVGFVMHIQIDYTDKYVQVESTQLNVARFVIALMTHRSFFQIWLVAVATIPLMVIRRILSIFPDIFLHPSHRRFIFDSLVIQGESYANLLEWNSLYK